MLLAHSRALLGKLAVGDTNLYPHHMGKLALGYGSEWHMMRYLGRYRSVLDEKVRAVTGATEIRWLDWNSAPTEVDAEWKVSAV